MAVPDWLLADERVRHSLHRPAQPASTTDFPEWVADPVRGALAQAGIHRLWQHQADAAAAAHAGRHVALATGTASGKTLAYLLPVLAASAEGRLGFEVTESGILPVPEQAAEFLAQLLSLGARIAIDDLAALVSRHLGGSAVVTVLAISGIAALALAIGAILPTAITDEVAPDASPLVAAFSLGMLRVG